MAKNIFTGVRIFAGGADLTGASNKAELSVEAEEKDVTTFASAGWNECVGGLKSGEVQAEGYWEAGDEGLVDNHMWGNKGAYTVPFTLGPTAATVGSLAYIMRTLQKDYSFFGEVGDVAPWSSNSVSNWPIARGVFMHPPATARTATGNGTAVQIIAVPAGSRLYSALHVTSVSGSAATLDVDVESYVDNTFAGATTQISHTQFTSVGGEILRTNGDAITDTWYRVTYTIGGTTPSFTFVSALGVA